MAPRREEPRSTGEWRSRRLVTELRAYNRSVTDTTRMRGLTHSCVALICTAVIPDPTRDSIKLTPQTMFAPVDVVYNGTPGRFIWVPTDQLNRLWLNLRVYNESAAA